MDNIRKESYQPKILGSKLEKWKSGIIHKVPVGYIWIIYEKRVTSQKYSVQN
jgi:hypothetical protein